MLQNPYLLAADNSPALLPLLRENPAIARQQDEHGYSLIHAAASYNHLDLLRALVTELNVPVDLRDEDSETALFVVETVEAAKCLVEELGLDALLQGADGNTAAEKIEEDGDYPEVVTYLRGLSGSGNNTGGSTAPSVNGTTAVAPAELPHLPEGISMTVGTISPQEEPIGEPDPEFRRRIQELAARDDFHTTEGQAQLRQLVMDAVAGEVSEGRNVRTRQ